MKVVINRKEFLNALQIGGLMSGKSKTLPILDNAKITLKDGSATISSYDNEVAVTKRTSIISYENDMVFCVNPRELATILKTLSEEETTLEITENTCNVKHKKGELSLPCENANEFPTPTLDSDMVKHSLKSETLYNFLKEAKRFVSQDVIRPVLTGANMVFENNLFSVSSSDGCVLYHNAIDYEYEGEPLSAIVTAKAIDSILPIIDGTDDTIVSIGEKNIIFKTDDSMVIAVKPEGRYPNVKTVIPKSHSIEVEVDKQEVIEAVNRTLILANKNTKFCVCDFNAMQCSISSEDKDFNKKAKEDCFCSCDGEIKLGLRGDYLLTILNTIDNEKAIIQMSAPNRAVVFKDADNANKILLQMPYNLES